jgi:hypothetical protein
VANPSSGNANRTSVSERLKKSVKDTDKEKEILGPVSIYCYDWSRQDESVLS